MVVTLSPTSRTTGGVLRSSHKPVGQEAFQAFSLVGAGDTTSKSLAHQQPPQKHSKPLPPSVVCVAGDQFAHQSPKGVNPWVRLL